MLQHLRKMSEPAASLLLLLLLSTDFAIMVFHIILETVAAEKCHTLGVCGYIHIYNLIKLIWIIILFVYVFKSTGVSGYASWILVFIYLFLDDALLIHQKVGDHLANILVSNHSTILGLGPRFFELAVLACSGLFFLAIFAWAYSHGAYVFRRISNDMFLFIAALIFFGLIVDLVSFIHPGSRAMFAFGLIEDGGELMVNSLIVWYVYLLAMRKGQAEVFLLDLLRTP